MPEGSDNKLELPDFDANTLERNHALAIEFFDAGNYFAAHEAWETCWGQAKGTADEEFFKGLRAARRRLHALPPRQRARRAGTAPARGRSHRQPGGSPHRGIDVRDFLHDIRVAHQVAAIVEKRGGELPPLRHTTVRRATAG